MSFSEICARYKKYGAIQNNIFGLCPTQKNGAIQKDLVADNEWSPYKCRCDIFVVWAPFKGLLLTYLICSRHRTEKEQNSLLPRIVGGMSRMLRSASALAASWQCQRCGCINNSAKNKRRCFLCRAWRDEIAPSSAAGIAIADAHGGGGTFFCSTENDAPALSI